MPADRTRPAVGARHYEIVRTDEADARHSLGPFVATSPAEAARQAEWWVGDRSYLKWRSWDLVDSATKEVVAHSAPDSPGYVVVPARPAGPVTPAAPGASSTRDAESWPGITPVTESIL